MPEMRSVSMNPINRLAQHRPVTHFPPGLIACPSCGQGSRIVYGHPTTSGYSRKRVCGCGCKFSTHQERDGCEQVALTFPVQAGDLRRDLLLLLVAHYQLCKAAGIPFRLDSDEMELAERIRRRK